ncbi:MAG: RluA family pseudouridine synthase [Verrucomicrobia bacterium]|nr:RluA family pseudouridine synthase [Verrucomicrobiota bacterium]
MAAPPDLRFLFGPLQPHSTRMEKLFEVLHEDAELLVINKPAGLVCHPTKTDALSSLISRVRLHLGPGAHPQLVNRLDRETSGVVVVAKTPEAARDLRRIWETRAVQKEYLAIVHGHPREETGLIEAPLGKDERSRVAIKDCVRADGAAAQTEYWVERRFTNALGDFTLLRVVPRTGRKHQIRIHLAHVGHPIVGDKLYGGDEDLYLALVEDRLTAEQRGRLILPNHALHASKVRFRWRGQERFFKAAPEACFSTFFASKGVESSPSGSW